MEMGRERTFCIEKTLLGILNGQQGGLGAWMEVSKRENRRRLGQRDSRMRWEDHRVLYRAYFHCEIGSYWR